MSTTISKPSVAPLESPESPAPQATALAKQFAALLRANAIVDAEVLGIWLNWVHQMKGFDPVVFWSTPVLSNTPNPSTRPLAHQLFLRRSSALGKAILDGIAQDLTDQLGPEPGAAAFNALLMLPGEKKSVVQNLFQTYWAKLIIPPPKSSTGLNYFSSLEKKEMSLLARIMDGTDSSTWTFRDEIGAHPGSGLVNDLMNLVREKHAEDSDVAPVIARVRAVFGQARQDPSQSPWLDLGADQSGRSLAATLVSDDHRVDEVVQVGDRQFPAWEWLYYKNLQSGHSPVALLLPLILALPNDGSVQPVALDPRFSAPGAPPDLDTLVDEDAPTHRSTSASELARARSDIAARVKALREVARATHRGKNWFPGMDASDIAADLPDEAIDISVLPGCPDLAVGSILDRLEQMRARDGTFAALTPSDNRASTGYIRRVLMTKGTDTLGRSAFLRLMRHRSDLLEKVESAIQSSPMHMATSMREQLVEQLTAPDLMGYTPLLWALGSDRGSDSVPDILRDADLPLTLGVEDTGLCSHWAKDSRWFIASNQGYSYGLRSPSPIRTVSPARVFQLGGPALVFGPLEEQKRWARRLEKVLEGWAATATESRVPMPSLKDTPSDVLWLMQAFVAVRGSIYTAVTEKSNGSSRDSYRSSTHKNKTFDEVAKEVWSALEGTLDPGFVVASQAFLAAAAANPDLATELGLCLRSNQNSVRWPLGLMSARSPTWTNSVAMSVRVLGPIMSWRCASASEALEALGPSSENKSSYNDQMDRSIDAELRSLWTTDAEHYLLSKAAGLEDLTGPAPVRAVRKL